MGGEMVVALIPFCLKNLTDEVQYAFEHDSHPVATRIPPFHWKRAPVGTPVASLF